MIRRQVPRAIHRLSVVLGQPITIAIMLLVIGGFAFIKNVETQAQNNAILKDTQAAVKNSQIIIERLETLSKQGVNAAEDAQLTSAQSKVRIDCFAELFARYTRDRQPIIIQDLANCDTLAASTGAGQVSSTQSSRTSTGVSAAPPSSSPSSGTGTPGNSPSSPPRDERALDRLLDRINELIGRVAK